MKEQIARCIFQSITQNKWLSIEYSNKDGKSTNYWIGIRNVDSMQMILQVDGFHIAKRTVAPLDKIYVASIKTAFVIDESYYRVPQELKDNILQNPDKYKSIFGNIPNLKILDYLFECTRLNSTPYKSEYSLLEHFDLSLFKNGIYNLTEEQFAHLVQGFQSKAKSTANAFSKTQYLCVNVLSIHTEKGLFLLAYKRLFLDVKFKVLRSVSDRQR